MLSSDPRISQLVAMTRLYAPVSVQKQKETSRLIASTEKFEDLPSWLRENLLLVERLHVEDEERVKAASDL